MKSLMIPSATIGALALALAASTATSQAQDYPVRDVTITVPFNAGGSADRMARAVANYLPKHLGVPVSVENRTGASGALGHTWFLQQPDDGRAVMVSPIHPYMISNILRGQGNFTLDDFSFINGQWQDYYVLLVNKEQPFQSMGELIEFIRDNPGQASTAIIIGDGGHLSTLMMFEELGIPTDAVNYVTYDGGGPMRTALAGNQVTFSVITGLGSEVISDEVRPLAVFTPETVEQWDAPPINEILSEYDAEIPVIPADLRTITVHASFQEKHPDRYEMLVEAYKATLEDEEFQSFISSTDIGSDWLGPEETTRQLHAYYELFEENADILQ